VRAVHEQVTDGDGQVVVGVHQLRGGGDDPVAVRVGVVGEGNLKTILEPNEPGHRPGAGAVHADLAIVIDCHERERRIDLRVYDFNVEAVEFVDWPPVMHGRAAERVHAQLEAGSANRVPIDDVPQVVDVGQDKISRVGGPGLEGRGERHALQAGIAAPQQLVGPVLDPLGHVGVGGAAVGRVVLEAAILGGIVRGRNDDAVREVTGVGVSSVALWFSRG